jgi:uncharacterized cupredoxin-like copper-binding protein
MNSRILAVLVPIAIVAACSSPAATPAGTHGPSAAPPSPSLVSVLSPAATDPLIVSEAPTMDDRGDEVAVTMTDAMRFEPGVLTVKAGEPITFVVKNAGVIVHEFFVGSEAEQLDHAAEMADVGMSHGHDNALSVAPGHMGSLTMTFATAESLVVGCHEPGHYEAGMAGTLTVVE